MDANALQLEQPREADGIASVFFFNGRLLTASDLTREQQARRDADARLGLALGSGIAHGLEVTGKVGEAEVAVTPGLAVNPAGETLYLGAAVRVSLAVRDTATPTVGSGFSACAGQVGGTTAVATGFYLLTIASVQTPNGRAATNSLTGIAECNRDVTIDGIKFRLVAVTLPKEVNSSDIDRLRNRAAYQCFALDDWAKELADPAWSAADGGTVAAKRPQDALGDCEVPLALIYFRQDEGIRFIDLWAVRRRPVQGDPLGYWDDLLTARRTAEMEALFSQFEEQVRDAGKRLHKPDKFVARERLAYLPPAGLLPAGVDGFAAAVFFAPLQLAVSKIPRWKIRNLLHDALFQEPIDVTTLEQQAIHIYEPDPPTGFVLYVREEPAVADTKPPQGDTGTTAPEPATLAVAVLDDSYRPVATIDDLWLQRGGKKAYRATRATITLDALKRSYKTVRLDAAGSTGGKGGMRPRSKSGGSSYQVDLRPVAQSQRQAVHYAEAAAPAIETTAGKIPVFVFEDVAAGDYLLKAMVAGRDTVSYAITLYAGRRTNIAFVLGAKGSQPTQPGRGVIEGDKPFRDPAGRLFRGIAVVPKFPVDPDPPPEDSYRAVEDPLVQQALDGLVKEVLAGDPNTPITSQGLDLQVSRDWLPGAAASGPYAYVVDATGASFPVVLLPQDGSVAGGIAVTQAGIAELDNDTFVSEIAGTALARGDVLANAWTGVVAGTLGVSERTAGKITASMAAQVAAVRSNLGYYPGLNAAAGAALAKAGYDDAAIANATAAALVATGGEALSLDTAERMVDRARGLVPTAAWKPDAAALGLTASQLAAAGAAAESLGSLQTALADEGQRTAIGQAMGLDAGSLGALATATAAAVAGTQLARAEALPVAGVAGLDAEAAGALSRAGIASVADLANTAPATVAATAGISQEAAAQAVAGAVARVIASPGGLSLETAAQVVSGSKAATLADLGKADVGAVGAIAGNRAHTVLQLGQLAGSRYAVR